jgi:uncharacterized membrane protein YcjF (UPF0283 family)
MEDDMAKGRRRRFLNYGQIAVDSATIFFGLATILAAVFVFMDFKAHMGWTAIIFLLSGCMSASIGIKSIFRKEVVKTILNFTVCVFLVIISVIVWMGTR